MQSQGERRIENLRLKINIVNSDIVRLLLSRKSIVEEIGEEKRNINIDVYDPKRETAILDDIKKQCSDKEYEYLEPIFKQLILSSRQVQINR